MKRAFLLLFLFLASCDQSNAQLGNAQLEGKISTLEYEVSALDARLKTVEDNILRIASPDGAVVLSPASKDYLISKNDSGNLFFSFQDVKKFANGYKVKVSVGNPNTATYKDVKLNIAYNKAFDVNTDFPAWNSELKTTTTRIDFLPAGQWKDIEITLSPCTEEETGWIKVTPEISTTLLGPQSR